MKYTSKLSKLIKDYYFKPFLFFKLWWLYLLITFWTLEQESKQIYFSLCHEKTRIFWVATIFLLVVLFFHSCLKLVFWMLKVPPQKNNKSILIQKQVRQLTKPRRLFLKLLFCLLASCLIAPIIEECIFRYFIFAVLGKNNPFSYLLSFLTFVLSHWQGGENIKLLFLQYSVATIGFIGIYCQSNWNLIYPIILHSYVNLVFIGTTLINPNLILI